MARKKKTETNSVSSPEPQTQDAPVVTPEQAAADRAKIEKYRLSQVASVEVLPKVQPLTDDERARLAKHEATFQQLEGILPNSVTGLIDIRDNRLYRETHDTFEAYCGEKLYITRRQADRLSRPSPFKRRWLMPVCRN